MADKDSSPIVGSENQTTKLPAGSGLAAARAGLADVAHAAAAESEKLTEKQTVQQQAKQAIEKENAEPTWNLAEWLRSLKFEEAFQEFLEKAAKDAGLSPLELVKGYADDGKEPELFFHLFLFFHDFQSFSKFFRAPQRGQTG